MTEINQNGRDELKRAYEGLPFDLRSGSPEFGASVCGAAGSTSYRLANEGDHNNLCVYVERVDGSESICEIYSEGTVYVEHPDGYTADMIPAVEMSEDEFMERAKRVIEQ